MFYVYIIQNEAGIHYKGFTENLERRLFEHQNSLGRYTKDKGPWVLVYSQKYETKREALIEEKRLKRLNVKSLEKLILG